MSSSGRLPTRRLLWLVAASTIALTAACAGGDDSGDGSAATAGASPTTAPSSGADETAVQLDVDPCELLTIPEAEAAIGPGVEEGTEEAGRCTYAIDGNVGAGAVSITIDPVFCDAIEQTLRDGTAAGTGLEVIDVGDGGVADVPTSTVTVLIGGGCISLNTGISGVRLDLADLTTLAEAAAGHVD